MRVSCHHVTAGPPQEGHRASPRSPGASPRRLLREPACPAIPLYGPGHPAPCISDAPGSTLAAFGLHLDIVAHGSAGQSSGRADLAVSYTHLRAHETVLDL